MKESPNRIKLDSFFFLFLEQRQGFAKAIHVDWFYTPEFFSSGGAIYRKRLVVKKKICYFIYLRNSKTFEKRAIF